MSTLVVGSVALDSVKTPYGTAEDALGGTALFFSLAASLFTNVRLVGVVGTDFPAEGIRLLTERGVDLAGLQQQEGQTFRWVGEYDYDMNIAHTLDTRLNVFETFHPKLPAHYRDAGYVFLGNIDPELQLDVLQQVEQPRLTALDTMNFWIERKKAALTEVVRQVDAVLINEAEIREFAGEYNVLAAAKRVQELGPEIIVIKRGEYGALLCVGEDLFTLPAYPTVEVRDTTGAGDSFAGGFVGYLAHCGEITLESLKAAAVCGTVLASHAVEDFSVAGVVRADAGTMAERARTLAAMTRVELPRQAPRRDLVTEGV